MVMIGGGVVEAGVLKRIHECIIKNFMNIIILTELRNCALSGYE